MARKVLVAGASIAGNAAAWWLGHHGFDVDVVERAPRFRKGGQNIDVRGVGREVLRRMGLERAALERGTGEEGTAWVDRRGRRIACFQVDEAGGGGGAGLTAEMEILRGDLADLIHTSVCENVRFRFGDSIAQVEQDGTGADVTFASGSIDRYEAVVVAEGVGSATRELMFPGEARLRWMDLSIAFFTIPRLPTDDRMWRWFNAPGGRGISLRPDRHGTTRAMLMLQRSHAGEQHWEPARQRAWLRQRFADAGWEASRVLDAMDETDDFYFDALRQVQMERWSNGRVVLLGDAAWCATPLAGIGATLSITGACVLAGAMSRSGSMGKAFQFYEEAMRPMVARSQGVSKAFPRLANPRTRLGIGVLHAALRVASHPMTQRLASKRPAKRSHEPELPEHA